MMIYVANLVHKTIPNLVVKICARLSDLLDRLDVDVLAWKPDIVKSFSLPSCPSQSPLADEQVVEVLVSEKDHLIVFDKKKIVELIRTASIGLTNMCLRIIQLYHLSHTYPNIQPRIFPTTSAHNWPRRFTC